MHQAVCQNARENLRVLQIGKADASIEVAEILLDDFEMFVNGFAQVSPD